MTTLSNPTKVQLHPHDRIPQKQGPLLDYVLTAYRPKDSLQQKWHSMSLLFHFLRLHKMQQQMKPILKSLYLHLGPNKIVWGVKYAFGMPSLELYFYNHCQNAEGNPMAISKLVSVLSPHLQIASVVDEKIPYIMCSLELTPKHLQQRKSEGFRMYLAGSQQQEGYDGVSFLITQNQHVRENEYSFFYDKNAPALQKLLTGSQFIAPYLKQAFPERYATCHSICYSAKQQSDALYFSRISTTNLRHFAKAHFSTCISPVLETHPDKFSHLCWDIGYDISAPFAIRKVGMYGFL